MVLHGVVLNAIGSACIVLCIGSHWIALAGLVSSCSVECCVVVIKS